ncbi:hypothetical protein SNEBB_001580 [Seison nebaliae]|nr:hypothetical protein SNEBB_001580 [Seison nebaliae]
MLSIKFKLNPLYALHKRRIARYFDDKENIEELEKLPEIIKIYYETHCDDCFSFFYSQVDNLIAHLRSYEEKAPLRCRRDMPTIQFMPFGNAKIVDGQLECQHGPDECYGNRLHAYIMRMTNHITNKLYSVLHFMSCSMSRNYFDYPLFKDTFSGNASLAADEFTRVAQDTNIFLTASRKCASKTYVEFENLRQCAKKREELLENFTEYLHMETDKAGVTYVPWIEFDDLHSEALQRAAEKDFVKLLCIRKKCRKSDRIPYAKLNSIDDYCGELWCSVFCRNDDARLKKRRAQMFHSYRRCYVDLQ